MASSMTTRPYFAASSSNGSMSTGCPRMSTGSKAAHAAAGAQVAQHAVAPTRSHPAGTPARASTSICQYAGSASTNTGHGPHVADGVRRGDERQVGNEHLVVRLDAGQQQGDVQCGGAVDGRDGVPGADSSRQRRSKPSTKGPAEDTQAVSRHALT